MSFFRKDRKCLILLLWNVPQLFHLSFRKRWFEGSSNVPELFHQLCELVAFEVAVPLLLPSSFPSLLLPARNLVVKITHSLYSELKLRAALRGRFGI